MHYVITWLEFAACVILAIKILLIPYTMEPGVPK